jgi:DUF4097 and DUF4098 domain-containing protein YvlB
MQMVPVIPQEEESSMRRFRFVIAGLLAGAMLTYAADRRFEKSFTVQPGGTLSVALDVGSIQVKGSSSGAVKVLAYLEGDRDAIDEYTIEASQEGGGVSVRGRSKKDFWKFWSWDDLQVRVTVEVPRSYNLRLSTAGGNLTIEDLEGRVEGETSGGNIDGRNITGNVGVETSGGNLSFEEITGDLRAETSGGNIAVRRVKGSVAVETSGGNVKVAEVDGPLSAETSGGDITVGVKQNRGVDVSTSGGDIRIALPAGTGASIDASTSGGSVTCDFPITMQGKVDDSRIRGSINGGGSAIRARTSGGDIEIRPAQ